MRKYIFICLFVLLLCSCSSTKTEYVPQELDITDSVQLIYDSRPSEAPDLPSSVNSYNDISLAVAGYKDAFERWMTYAKHWEDFINILKPVLTKN